MNQGHKPAVVARYNTHVELENVVELAILVSQTNWMVDLAFRWRVPGYLLGNLPTARVW